MTKQKLKKLSILKAEIDMLEDEIFEMDKKQKYNEEIFGVGFLVEGLNSEIENYKQQLISKTEEYYQVLGEIEEYLDSIEDAEIRMIFRCRYIKKMTWMQIAFQIGYFDEQRPRKKHNKFLSSTTI